MFTTVNSVWIESMAETAREPAVLSVARREGLLEQLTDANEKLDVIQKGLSDYLETKRLAFPRFFFLSNDELLEILAETKDPTKVQLGVLYLEFGGLWRLHAVDATRVHLTSMRVVSLLILRPFGPSRSAQVRHQLQWRNSSTSEKGRLPDHSRSGGEAGLVSHTGVGR